ncbi:MULTISPECIES: cell division protein [Enterobacteriaceae]|uniref:cell division protein n=1 Tax=Enterobacteriaceae TaxID=543 RepID=UPI0011B29040|nr:MULTISPECIES: cell division protein [Enterobacteriaceae]ELY4220333.1 hypothetical protein [Cronobacter sakazakii]ELY5874815.1 hypothetical protein [Cronobacter sakazakii]MBR9958031.1 hypothetical protein [Cronobacter sakazakii]MDK2711409.1 hypothetical protein [Enterobacter cloacae]
MTESAACTSRNIPRPIQREVRQRCGFGCVICGTPLYEYEHMEEWAEVKRHVAEEITLLCDKHHKEKTNGWLPKEDVRKANLDPFNLRAGVSPPYTLHFSGSEMSVKIGTDEFFTPITEEQSFVWVAPVMVDGIPLIGFVIQDNHILLNVNLFDRENNPLLTIINNQLIYNINAWDIQLVGTKLTIREKERVILLEIDFKPPNKVVITRGSLYCNGVEVKINGDELRINESGFTSGNKFWCNVGIGIGSRSHNQGTCGLAMQINRR